MRTSRIVTSFAATSVLAFPLFGQNSAAAGSPGCPVAAIPNVNQLALLKWFNANVSASFPSGDSPLGMAFDGSSMWIVNTNSSSVSKLTASDGAVLGTFAVGYIPGYVAFDGANVWVTNLGDNTVSKLRASDGANLGTFSTGKFPWVITLDGTSIWDCEHFRQHCQQSAT